MSFFTGVRRYYVVFFGQIKYLKEIWIFLSLSMWVANLLCSASCLLCSLSTFQLPSAPAQAMSQQLSPLINEPTAKERWHQRRITRGCRMLWPGWLLADWIGHGDLQCTRSTWRQSGNKQEQLSRECGDRLKRWFYLSAWKVQRPVWCALWLSHGDLVLQNKIWPKISQKNAIESAHKNIKMLISRAKRSQFHQKNYCTYQSWTT